MIGMNIKRQIINFIPPCVSYIPIGLKHYLSDRKNIDTMLGKVRRQKKLAVRHGGIDDDKSFYRNLKEYCVFFNLAGADKYLESYFDKDNLQLVKRTYTEVIPKNEIIMICCVRNDANRIKKVLEHHRKIGIKYMVFVDNMSDDGTWEWLLEQDADIFQVDEKYHAGRKAAWVRKIQDIYGYNRWYLIVDSDELFTFVGEESHDIHELTTYAERNGYQRIKSMLLDMYTDHEAYRNHLPVSDFADEYVYFDSDTYYEARDCRGEMIRGGPRPRVFQYGKGYDNPLTKYPLIYAKREDVWGDHTPVPFKKNFGCPLISVLRHYKFMNGDMEKYREAVANGNYYDNSIEYRSYISAESGLTFLCKQSEKYVTSESLLKIKGMHRM